MKRQFTGVIERDPESRWLSGRADSGVGAEAQLGAARERSLSWEVRDDLPTEQL